VLRHSIERSASVSGTLTSSVSAQTPIRIAGARLTRAGASRQARERAHASAAHDSRQSCSQTIHSVDHFVAAVAPCGSIVFELLV